MRWFRDAWRRFKSWLFGEPKLPALEIPADLLLINPPMGYPDWFTWESVQFTNTPSAFWLDPFRNGYEPTLQERYNAQDAVARLFGVRVDRLAPAADPARSWSNAYNYGNALQQAAITQNNWRDANAILASQYLAGLAQYGGR